MNLKIHGKGGHTLDWRFYVNYSSLILTPDITVKLKIKLWFQKIIFTLQKSQLS